MELKAGNQQEKSNETKSCFFEKINKTDYQGKKKKEGTGCYH